MYADYQFYTTKYFGNVISQNDFPRYEDRASDKLDYLTMNRIKTLLITDSNGDLVLDDSQLSVKIKKAVCKVAEILADIEQLENASRQSIGYETTANGLRARNIQSISAGAESITYATSTTTQQSAVGSVITDKVAQDKLIFDAVRDYLGGTYLLSQVL